MISYHRETQQVCELLKAKVSRKKEKLKYFEDNLKYKEQELEKRDG